MTKGLLITGTDTDVGKTYLTALIARQLIADGLLVGAYKPVCSGATVESNANPVWSDVEILFDAINAPMDRDDVCPQCFRAPLAPPMAARKEGKSVDVDLLYSGALCWRDRVDILLIEAVGGLLCPLAEQLLVADFAAILQLPLIIVARAGLGTINHTLLTTEVAQARGLEVAGIVINHSAPDGNDSSIETNSTEIAARTEFPVLGTVPYRDPIGLLQDGTPIRIDWASIAGPL